MPNMLWWRDRGCCKIEKRGSQNWRRSCYYSSRVENSASLHHQKKKVFVFEKRPQKERHSERELLKRKKVSPVSVSWQMEQWNKLFFSSCFLSIVWAEKRTKIMHLDNFWSGHNAKWLVFGAFFEKNKSGGHFFLWSVDCATWCGMTLFSSMQAHMQVKTPTGWGLARERDICLNPNRSDWV